MSALTRGFSDIVKSSPIDTSLAVADEMRASLATFTRGLATMFEGDDDYGRPDDEASHAAR